MHLDEATNLFERLKAFKTQQELVQYCEESLSPVEKEHYDYKTKADSRNPKLEASDQNNLAKALSGFSNSAGGVLTWGIENETLKPRPIAQAHKFLDYLLELAPNATEPSIQGVDGHVVPADSSTDDGGFILLLIRESEAPPHRVLLRDREIQGHYYIRCASSFMKASHSQLEDMFGRRPRPKLVLELVRLTKDFKGNPGTVNAVFKLRNNGRGLAKRPFVIAKLSEGFKGYGGRFQVRNSNVFEENGQVGVSMIDDEVIHPGVDLEIVGLSFNKVNFAPGQLIKLDCMVSAEGQQLTPYTFETCFPTKL